MTCQDYLAGLFAPKVRFFNRMWPNLSELAAKNVAVKKEFPIKKNYYDGFEELISVDLPVAYSMSPFTSKESITSSYAKNRNPDAIINIVDATNLSRSLFFTTQLLELSVPVVMALNKSDINVKKNTKIDAAALGGGFVPGLIAVAAIVAIVVPLIRKVSKVLQTKYALSSK